MVTFGTLDCNDQVGLVGQTMNERTQGKNSRLKTVSCFRQDSTIGFPAARDRDIGCPVLYVLTGERRISSSDKTGHRQTSEIAAGDIVHIGTEKHRHGAAPDSFMIHMAINTGTTCWMERVQDEAYERGFGRG